jgi:hypothetical protein
MGSSQETAGEHFPATLHGVSPDEAANARGPIDIPTIRAGFLQSTFFSFFAFFPRFFRKIVVEIHFHPY